MSLKMTVKVRPLGSFNIDPKACRRVMGQAAREVAKEAKSILRAGAGGGRTYFNSGGNSYKPYVRGRHQASAPGEAPATQTGFLSNSLKAISFKSGQGFAVRDTAFYSQALEGGATGGGRRGSKGQQRKDLKQKNKVTTRKLAPRPFLSTALERKWPSVSSKIAAALQDGVKYVADKRPK